MLSPFKFALSSFKLVYANDIDAYIPEFWANESLAILEENMVAANLVHRDFQDEIANYGDVVNTRKPGEFVAYRKTNSDNVTDQNATATNVPVRLNQHIHVTFVIKDGEESKSKLDLVQTFIQPAMLAHARMMDQIVLGQYPAFMHNRGGKLGTAGTVATLLDMRQVMTENKVYMDGRRLILTPSTETDLLKLDIFTQAHQVGDDGTALREAWLGRKYGYDTYTCQNMSTVATGNTTVTGAVNNSGGYAAGTTTMTVDGLSAALPVNSWFTVAGDMTPQRIISSTGGATPTAVVFWPGLKYAVADDAVITRYVPGQINNSGGYAAGYSKEITVDTFSVAPRVGQFVSFGVSTSSTFATNPYYTVIQVNGTTGITLDRPLDVAVSDDDKVNIGPAGHYNFAFHRNAIALVVRPLALPPAGTGARAANINHKGLGIRAVITYDGQAQGTRVTLDLLCGVCVLDNLLGGVFLA